MHIKRKCTKARVFALLLALLMLMSTGAMAFAHVSGQGLRETEEIPALNDAPPDDTPSLWRRFTALFERSNEEDGLGSEGAAHLDEAYGEEMSVFALSDDGVLPVDMDADSFILDPIIERHIRENYDPAFTSLDNMAPVSAMYVKNLIVDEGLREGMTTFAEIMTDVFKHPKLIVTQTVGVVPVYVLSEDSAYYVAFINTMIGDPGIQTFDYAFAILNNEGEVVEGYYDFDTGIAYIPRHLFYDEDGIVVLFEIQAQLLQSRFLVQSHSGEMLPMASAYFVMDEAEDGDVAQVEAANIFSFETRIETEPGLNPANLSLVMNGLTVPSEAYEYDPDMGVITLSKSSGSIFSVQVIYGETLESGYLSIVPQDVFAMPTLGRIMLLADATTGSGARFDTAFRFQHAPARPNLNIAMYPNYNAADLTRLVNDILNNNVNMDQLRVANRNVIQAVILYLVQDRSYGDLFRVTEAPHLFSGINFIQIPLICADIPTPLGTRLPSVNPGTFNWNPGIDVFARVLYLTDQYVLMGFTSQRINAQAGVAVVRFRRDTPPPPPVLELIKTSETDRVAGVEFRITGPDGFHSEVTTGENGRVTVPGVTPGVFTVTEINIPAGYEPQAPQTVTLVAGQTAEVRFHNRRVPDDPPDSAIRIIKTSDTGRIAGVRFQVTGPGGFDQIVTTGENGTVDILDLEPGSYSVIEIDIPPGYAPQPPQTRTIMPGEHWTFRFHNTLLYGHVGGIKVGETAGQFHDADGLAGAVIGLFRAGETTFTEQTALAVVTTGANGAFVFRDLLYGDYMVREIAPPTGYVLNDTLFPVRVNQHGQTVQIRIENRLIRGDVEGIKTGEDTHGMLEGILGDADGLAGALIGIFAADETEFTEATALETVVTNERGHFAFTGLVYGYYLVREIAPPEGYVLNDTVFPVRIDTDGQVIEIQIENTLIRGRVEGIKTGEDCDLTGAFNDSTGLEGALIGLFGLADVEFVLIDGPDDEPEYNGSDNPGEDDAYAEANPYDDEYDEQDENGDEEEPEKRMVIHSIAGIPYEEFAFDAYYAVQTVMTAQDGSFSFDDVIFGTYLVREITPPAGYMLNDTVFLVTVTEDGQVIRVEIDNTLLRGRIEGIKVGEDSDSMVKGAFTDTAGLEGAVIGLFGLAELERSDSDTNEPPGDDSEETDVESEDKAEDRSLFRRVISWFARDNGEYEDDEYDNDADGDDYLPEDGETDDRDRPIDAIVRAIGGVPLEDFAFTRETALLYEITDENGAFAFENLVYGVYIVREIEAPTGYVLNDALFVVEVTSDGQVILVELENRLIRGGVEGMKLSADTEAPLAGAVFGLFRSDETVFTRESALTIATSDADGAFAFEGITFGTYIVREIQAPEGYVLSDEVFEIEITEDGQVIEIVVENEPEPEKPDRSITIRTQAHTGDGETQYFTPGETLDIFDDVFITADGDWSDTDLAFQVFVFGRLGDATRLLYESEMIPYTPEGIEDLVRYVIRNFETSTLRDGEYVFFAERMYSENPEYDPDAEDSEQWLSEYEHNMDGKDENQWLRPDKEEPGPKPPTPPTPTPNRPGTTAPQTGDETSLPWLVLILSGLGIAVFGFAMVKLNAKNKTE